MRAGVWMLLAACGRSDFDPIAARDGSVTDQQQADIALDAAELGLVVHLRMEDDPTDGKLDNSVGGPVFASCITGTTCGTATAGPRGQALLLDGIGQYYTIPSSAALLTPNGFTVAAWARVDTASAQHQYMATKRYDLIHNSWSIRVDGSPGDDWQFESASSPATGSFDRIAGAEPGVWRHLAITWDGGTKRAYLDGVRVLDFIPPDIDFDNGELLIGCDNDGSRYGFFTGAIDELRIYDRKLSDFEVQQLTAQ